MGQLSQNNQQIKRSDERKLEFDLIENKTFLITQITHKIKFLETILKVLQSRYSGLPFDKKTSNIFLE